MQYSAALIITAEDTSWELLYQELGLESFTERRWYHELVFFYEIIQGVAPSYLQSYLLPENNRTYQGQDYEMRQKHLPHGHQLFTQSFFLIAQKNETKEMMALRRLN